MQTVRGRPHGLLAHLALIHIARGLVVIAEGGQAAVSTNAASEMGRGGSRGGITCEKGRHVSVSNTLRVPHVVLSVVVLLDMLCGDWL